MRLSGPGPAGGPPAGNDQPAPAPPPAAGRPGSARKQELLDAAYQYVLGNGLADMSLRPLAKAIGSSPRVLLFLFSSKEDLTRALLARARQDELACLAALRDGQGPAMTGREIWSWLAAPSHRALLVLWVEGYARSLLGEPGPWADFGSQTVRDWLDLLATCQPARLRDTPEGAAERTLLLAVLRGALLDLLATGDTDRVTRAVELHLRERKANLLREPCPSPCWPGRSHRQPWPRPAVVAEVRNPSASPVLVGPQRPAPPALPVLPRSPPAWPSPARSPATCSAWSSWCRSRTACAPASWCPRNSRGSRTGCSAASSPSAP